MVSMILSIQSATVSCTRPRIKAHTSGEAAAHMQRKYEHFKDEIKTPEDFIRLSATRSLISGKLYYVKLKDGKKITSEAWLRQALEDYRQKQD